LFLGEKSRVNKGIAPSFFEAAFLSRKRQLQIAATTSKLPDHAQADVKPKGVKSGKFALCCIFNCQNSSQVISTFGC